MIRKFWFRRETVLSFLRTSFDVHLFVLFSIRLITMPRITNENRAITAGMVEQDSQCGELPPGSVWTQQQSQDWCIYSGLPGNARQAPGRGHKQKTTVQTDRIIRLDESLCHFHCHQYYSQNLGGPSFVKNDTTPSYQVFECLKCIVFMLISLRYWLYVAFYFCIDRNILIYVFCISFCFHF